MNKLNGFTALGLIEFFCFTFSLAHVKTIKILPLFDIQRPNTFTDFFIIFKQKWTCNLKICNATLVYGTNISIF